MMSVDHYICPGCGTEVPVGGAGCPKCNPPKKKKSWEQDEHLDGISLSDDEFDYEEFKEREFGGGLKPKGLKPMWWITGILVLIAFALLSMGKW